MAMALAVAMVACQAAVKSPASVKKDIADLTFGVGASAQTVDKLSSYFNVTNATFSASSNNERVATAKIAGEVLTVTPVGPGTANVTVTAKGDEGEASQSVKVTVNAPPPPPTNDPPTVRTISPVSLQVGGSPKMITLSDYFTDPDGEELEYDAESSMAMYATAAVDGAMLTITAVAAGTTEITVSATDGENPAVSQTFDVTVTAAPVDPTDTLNEPPEQTLIDDMEMRREGTIDIDLSMYYDDPEDERLMYTAESSMPAVAAVTLSEEMLTIEGRSVGKARITVSASDGTNTRRQSFSVTVGSNPPVVDMSLPTSFPLGLAGATEVVNLSKYFDDPEGDSLTYGAESSNTAVAEVSEPDADGMITITAVAAASKTEVGTATITVTAKDADNAAVSLDLFVTVSPPDVDNTPPAVRGINDMELETGEQATLDLGMHFIDAPGDELSYTADSIMKMYVTVAVDGSTLTITAVDEGTSRITVKATDSYGAAATTFFMVTVVPPNMAPVVDTEIPNQSLELDFADKMKTLDLSMYFSDPDSGPDALSYEAASSMEMNATVAVDDSMLTITAVDAGMATITVTASDGEDSVQDMFTVEVNNPAPPTATSELPDQDFAHDDMDARMFTLSDYFSKATMYDVSVSGDADVVTATEADGVLTLTPGSAGDAVVKVTPSNSGGIGSSQTINVTVADEPEELMLPPRPVGTIAAQTVELGATKTVNVNFVEPEGEPLEYDARSSDEAIATATVSAAGVVSITGVAIGEATITVTATDTDMQTAEQPISVKVVAVMPVVPVVPDPPTIKDTFQNVSFAHGATAAREFTLVEYFDGAAEYDVMRGNPAIIDASETDGVLSITPKASGRTYVRVTAINDGGRISQTISVEVMRALPMVPPTGTHQVLVDNLNSGDNNNESEVFTKDLIAEGYFLGGKGPFTFTEDGDPEATDSPWETSEIKDGILKLQLAYVDGTTTFTDAQWTGGVSVTVTATDANRQRATTTVTVMPNRAPRVLSTVGTPGAEGALSGEDESYVIGTMSGEVDTDTATAGIQPREDGAAMCSMFNECALKLFEDDEKGYNVVVTSPASDKYRWRFDKAEQELILTGLQSTWDADADGGAADDPVTVKVKATDSEGRSSDEVSFMLTVNAAPTVGDDADDVDKNIEIARDASEGTLNLMTAAQAADLFEDTEGDDIAGSFESSNDSIVTISDAGVMTLGARGTATIMVRGTTGDDLDEDDAGLGQYAEFNIRVRVK